MELQANVTTSSSSLFRQQAISQPRISFWASSTSDSFRISRERSSSHSFGAQALSRQKLGPPVQAQSQNTQAQVGKKNRGRIVVGRANVLPGKVLCRYLQPSCNAMEAQPWSEMLGSGELHLQKHRDAGSKEER